MILQMLDSRRLLAAGTGGLGIACAQCQRQLAPAVLEEDAAAKEGLLTLSVAEAADEEQSIFLRRGEGSQLALAVPSWRLPRRPSIQRCAVAGALLLLLLAAAFAWAAPATGHIRFAYLAASEKMTQENRALHIAQITTGSCALYGCVGYNRTNRCQCNSDCIDHQSCCSDFMDICMFEEPEKVDYKSKGERKGSCAKYGCIDFQPQHDCQCNSNCAKHNSCCDDVEDQCSGKWPENEVSHKQAQEAHRRETEQQRNTHDEFLNPQNLCSQIHLGDRLEVRDSAIPTWLSGTVTSLDPVTVKPDGWDAGYLWSAIRQDKALGACRPRTEEAAQEGDTTCHTAVEGEECYDSVKYAMEVDIKKNKHLYEKLGPTSSFADFQGLLHTTDPEGCPKPCEAGSSQRGRSRQDPRPRCLCLFDADRTLTCKQGEAEQCPGTRKVDGVHDPAFSGGTLTLSELGQNLSATFCRECFRGIVSAGPVGGSHSQERLVLLEALGGHKWTLSDKWSRPFPHVTSALVVGAPDFHKQDSVQGIVHWLRTAKGVEIEDREVYFFDDNVHNPPPFAKTSFNARQVSCRSRGSGGGEQFVGFCGARASEVARRRGVFPCQSEAADEVEGEPPGRDF